MAGGDEAVGVPAGAGEAPPPGGAGRLAGKTVFVTGAARGIGRVLATGFAAEGATVHLADLEDPGEVLAGLPEPRRGLALRCDVSQVARYARRSRSSSGSMCS